MIMTQLSNWPSFDCEIKKIMNTTEFISRNDKIKDTNKIVCTNMFQIITNTE
jgi:hypothetical protein